MRTFQTEDGYKFYEQPDGTLTDDPDPERADMMYENLEALMAAVGIDELPAPGDAVPGSGLTSQRLTD